MLHLISKIKYQNRFPFLYRKLLALENNSPSVPSHMLIPIPEYLILNTRLYSL